MAASLYLFQRGGTLLSPRCKVGVHLVNESRELRVLIDGGFDGRLVHRKIEEAGAVVLKEGLPEPRTDSPVTLEDANIGFGNAALQMARDVLKVFRRLAVDVARKVEIELVLVDLLEADHASVFWDFEPLGEDIDDFVNVLGAEAILGAVLHKACAGID